MRSFAYHLLRAKNVEYTFEADEKLNSFVLPMQARKNFYLVFKEAITNLVKYSEASRVRIHLFERGGAVVLQIQDNGKGLPDNPETQGNGLLNMHRRAKEIKGNLLIHSANGSGTTIELIMST
jgi:signal transduction histidine kinase